MRLNVLVQRHAQRADEAGEPWPEQDSRPWDPPLSRAGAEEARAAGAALAATPGLLRPTRIVASPYTRCLQTAAGVLAGLGGEGGGGCAQVEVDPALAEVAGPPFVRGAPWDDDDDDDAGDGGGGGAWVWAGGSAAAALAATGLPPSTPVAGDASSAWPRPLPESLEAAHARYDRAIAAATAREARRLAVAGQGGDGTPSTPPTLLLITHGEAVRRAVTRVDPAAVVYEARHCGWVACEWRRDGDADDDDPGEWALLRQASAGVAWLDPAV